MKRQIMMVTMVSMLVFFLGFSSAIGEDADKQTQLKNYYEKFILEKISKCRSKAGLQASKSTHLQNCAAMEIKKANFLSSNKEMLITEMLEKKVGVKPYKIEYFLNKMFHESNGSPNDKIIKAHSD